MFHPHNGMAAEPTAENVDSAVHGKLKLSFDWLSSKPGEIAFGEHPVTGSSKHFCLFDSLHETNCSKERKCYAVLLC